MQPFPKERYDAGHSSKVKVLLLLLSWCPSLLMLSRRGREIKAHVYTIVERVWRFCMMRCPVVSNCIIGVPQEMLYTIVQWQRTGRAQK